MPRSSPPVGCRESEVGENDTDKAHMSWPAALAYPALRLKQEALGFAPDSRDHALVLASVLHLL